MNSTGNKYRSKAGFTLIEVLITLVILSIGLLGMAGIQIQGLRGTTSSAVRSQATILANDIAERIRMNVDGLSTYTQASITRNANGDPQFTCGTPTEESPITFPDSVTTVCSASPLPTPIDGIPSCSTAADMAAFDIYEFACGLAGDGGVVNLLPNGTASIGCNDGTATCGPGSEISITINWTENNTAPDADGAQQTKTLSMVIIP